MSDRARIARFQGRGERDYVVICEQHKWISPSWKTRDFAKNAMEEHNKTQHRPEGRG